MAEDWLADVRKYVADADEKVVAAIVRHCGIALQKRDSSLVSFSDSKETDRVRENFLKKKLGLTHDDATLDAAITAVGERMKGDRTKNRVTVYYLLTEHFGLFDIFGGAARAAGAAAAGLTGAAAAAGAAAGAALGGDEDKADAGAGTGAAAPLAAAGLAGAGLAGGASAVEPPAPIPAPEPVPAADTRPAAAYGNPGGGSGGDDRGGGMGWLPWLLLALIVAALIFFGLRSCSKEEAAAPAGADVAATAPAVPGDTPTPDAAATAAATPAVPEGAGVVGAERDGKPMLSVYFDTGKSEVSNDLSGAAAGVKAYLAAHPGATLAVSGFNDATGNAALNAELSKKRAQGVAKALEGVGIAAASIKLEKPADTTGTGTDNAAARRVEVVVKD
ncbi:DUF2853 family protein [Sphingopyxis sp.]|uniref:DUF2853 family protein n=1 Tax=Sphingopyxis sp. TaxID=1908224 RepID=UPI003D0AB158